MLVRAALFLLLTATSLLLSLLISCLVPFLIPFPGAEALQTGIFIAGALALRRSGFLQVLEVAVTQVTGTKSSKERLREAGLVTTK